MTQQKKNYVLPIAMMFALFAIPGCQLDDAAG